MPELNDDEVRRTRVAAQRLHRPDRLAVPDLVSRLVAVQAQDIAGGPLALRARSLGLTAADVLAARADRSVVRTWGPRGTLHLIATEDLPWLLGLVGHRQLTGVMRRLAQEGVAGTAEELRRTTVRAIEGQGPLTKVQLAERLAERGLVASGQGLVYLAFLAAVRGELVLGPDRGNKPTYVHAADWLGAAVTLPRDRERGLAELARRYLRVHAPAGPEDLATWAGLSLGDARIGWAAIAGELVEVTHRGTSLWRPRRGGPGPAEVKLSLLAPFDEYLLGWRGRELVLDQTYAKRVLPGGGMLRATVLADGRLVGTWRLTQEPEDRTDRTARQRRRVEVDLLAEVDPAALAAEAEDVARFLGSPESNRRTGEQRKDRERQLGGIRRSIG